MGGNKTLGIVLLIVAVIMFVIAGTMHNEVSTGTVVVGVIAGIIGGMSLRKKKEQ